MRARRLVASLPSGRHDRECAELLTAQDPALFPSLAAAFGDNAVGVEEVAGCVAAAGLEPVDVWVEERRRRTEPERHLGRLTTVGAHLFDDVPGASETARSSGGCAG